MNTPTFLPFADARLFARTLGLPNRNAWVAWAKTAIRPVTIPADPRGCYLDTGWSGWGDWLGTGTIAPRRRVFRPFEEAQAYVGDQIAGGQKPTLRKVV